MRAVTVRVPATSANLGPGFDAFGLALARYDEVEVELADAGLRVEVVGEGAAELPRDERHLVVRALRAAYDELGRQPPGLRLRCRNRIPQGRGLGSSAAAIVAGVSAAGALAGTGFDDQAALRLCARLEGHPDNVAAALLGGLTLAWQTPSGARAVRLPLADDLPIAVLVPAETAATDAARGLLPATVPHADAATNAGRAGLLAAALSGRVDLLLDATEDRLHQRYRAPAVPATAVLVDRLRAAGLAAAVSGAGPSVVVLGADADAVRPHLPAGWELLALDVDRQGAVTTL